METKRTFSRTFKLHVVNEISTGKISKEEARLKYGIRGNSAILNWSRQFAKERKLTEMKQPVIQMDRMELENKIKDLEKALSDERFKTRAYEIYLEELEKVVGKPSSKKSGTGQ
jgi:transposase